MKKKKESLLKKNEKVILQIEDIGIGGEGIGFVQLPAKTDIGQQVSMETEPDAGKSDAGKKCPPEKRQLRFPVFVKDAVPGDTIEAVITKTASRYAYGHLNRVLCPSPCRVAPPCPIARTCGGCQIQAVDYPKQLEFKQKKVRENLIRIGGFTPETIDQIMRPIVGMEDPWRYRNKEQVPVQQGNYGPVTGFYASHSHTVIPMTDCLIGRPENRQILETILAWMQEHGVPAYDEKTGKGLIRHILIRSGFYSGQIMVCVIANDYRLPCEKELVEALRGIPLAEPMTITSIVLNTNTDRTNVITGRALRTLWGTDEIEDTLYIHEVVRDPASVSQEPTGYSTINHGAAGHSSIDHNSTDSAPTEHDLGNHDVTGHNKEKPAAFKKTEESVTFRISPLSFYQINPRQTEKLYSLALDCAGLTGSETVWDLYCGVGTISLFMARHAGHVCGVEIIPEAIENARRNAAENGIENADFYVGKAEEVLPAYVENLKAQGKDPQIDVICVDPPRKGCDEKCIRTMLEIAPKRIVYVSCDPATLARDLKKLADGGYEPACIQPLDQFPGTVHCETIVLLQKPAS